MDQRVDVTDQEMTEAMRLIGEGLQKRILQKGRKCFIGPHEIFGMVAEEFNKELMDAMHKNDRSAFVEELIDVGVTCLFGIASMRAQARVAVPPPAPAAKPATGPTP